MKEYIFSGTTTIEKNFVISVFDSNYERAEQKALDLLKNTSDSEYYDPLNEETTIDIEEVSTEKVFPDYPTTYELLRGVS